MESESFLQIKSINFGVILVHLLISLPAWSQNPPQHLIQRKFSATPKRITGLKTDIASVFFSTSHLNQLIEKIELLNLWMLPPFIANEETTKCATFTSSLNHSSSSWGPTISWSLNDHWCNQRTSHLSKLWSVWNNRRPLIPVENENCMTQEEKYTAKIPCNLDEWGSVNNSHVSNSCIHKGVSQMLLVICFFIWMSWLMGHIFDRPILHKAKSWKWSKNIRV